MAGAARYRQVSGSTKKCHEDMGMSQNLSYQIVFWGYEHPLTSYFDGNH